MIELEQAIELVKQAMPLQTQFENIPLNEAFGRVTAKAVTAPIAVPGFARSAMDGYAVMAADTRGADQDHPVKLPVIASVFAGDDIAGITPKPQTAVRIMTGAPIPEGYDAVAKQEWTDYGEPNVSIYKEVPDGKNFAPIGEDVSAGQEIFPPHTYLDADSMAILASLGLTEVPVLKPLRVGLLATGNEIVVPGQPLPVGKIYNSTTYALSAYIRHTRGQLIFHELCGDDPKRLGAILNQYQDQFDVLITTGGVSVGQKDFMPDVLEHVGAKTLFHTVALVPGTPVMAATWQGKLVLALPGNPFAALVNFHLFYWAALGQFLDNDHYRLQEWSYTLQTEVTSTKKLRRFLRAKRVTNGVEIREGGHRSGIIHNLNQNDCIVEQPANTPLTAGQQVKVLTWPLDC